MVVKTDYSYTNKYLLCQDLIDQTYFANVYTSLPDRSLETCLDYPYLEKSGSSVELPSDLDFCPAFCPVPLFSELRQRPASSFNRHPAFDLGLPISPNTSFFFASPLCSHEIPVLASPTLSLSSLECETPKEATLSSEDLALKQPQRNVAARSSSAKFPASHQIPPSTLLLQSTVSTRPASFTNRLSGSIARG
jgi:hypothetical protein